MYDPKKRMKIFLSLFLGLAILCVVWASQPALAQQETAAFTFAYNLYKDGMYDLAIGEFDKFIRNFPQSVKVVDALLYQGVSQQKLKRYQDAIKSFERLLADYPNSFIY